MRNLLIALSLISTALLPGLAQTPEPPTWRTKLDEAMPLLGHRNWILIVDSAYPLQTSSGIETLETNTDQSEVVREVLHAINRSIHVRPVITMDSELHWVSEDDAPGVTAYRNNITDMLRDFPVTTLPHDQVISQIAQASEQFHVLVLKTNMTVPYTSVFIRLDCKYWSADAESRLRAKITASHPPAH
jgi:D-ribose pyranose/furanose isomerase RbsD